MSGLPKLPDVQYLSPCVTCILGQNPSPFTLQGTNTYLIGRPDSDERLLIDTGSGHAEYLSVLKHLLQKHKWRITAITVTHSHIDHVGGVEQVLALSPGAAVCKYVIAQPATQKHAHRFLETTGMSLTHLEDGDTVDAGGVHVKAYYTPGHCCDHLSFWLEEEHALFSGDNLLGHGSSVFEDYRLYMQSLLRMRDLPSLKRVYPGHGRTLENGVAAFNSLIEHRYERIAELFAVLDAAGTALTEEELVARVYKDFTSKPRSVQIGAINNARNYLHELERQGRTKFEGGRWAAVV